MCVYVLLLYLALIIYLGLYVIDNKFKVYIRPPNVFGGLKRSELLDDWRTGGLE